MIWTPQLDRKIEAAAARGLSAQKIAAIVPGATRNGVIARLNRIRGHIFDSDLARRREAAERMKQRAANRAARAAKAVAFVRAQIAAGVPRDLIIIRAHSFGHTLQEISAPFGICRERVRQILQETGAAAPTAHTTSTAAPSAGLGAS